jgi:hypothetical protein
MLLPIITIYEAVPPACIGANVSQTTIIITIEKADKMLGENLLYTVMSMEGFGKIHQKRPASPLLWTCRSFFYFV